jgi:hypothetical protein
MSNKLGQRRVNWIALPAPISPELIWLNRAGFRMDARAREADCMHFVPIEWEKTLPASEAYREPGFFANQNTAARFRHRATLDKLYAHFGVSAPESSDVPIDASQS